jgi:DNA-binding CsgD family transcriptional regulator
MSAAHDHGLTVRELEVLDWVACGKTNQEIAVLLVISPHTVRTHLEHVYEKLGVHSRTAALAAVSAKRS